MQSILIKDTTREERIRIVNQSLNVCGNSCEFCNGCDNLGGGSVFHLFTKSVITHYIAKFHGLQKAHFA